MASRNLIIGNLEVAAQIPLLRRYDMARRAGLAGTTKKFSIGETLLFIVNSAIPRQKAIGKGEAACRKRLRIAFILKQRGSVMKSICRATYATVSALVLTAVLLIGCSGDDLLGSESQPSSSAIDELAGPTTAKQGSGATTLDVSGDWIWSREDHLTFPVFVAQDIFGVEPEGPTTSARCETSGTMTLIQVGATLSGTLQETEHQCVTKGGQVFADPLIFSPNAITGGVRGRSVELLSDGELLDCRYRAVASDLEGNSASRLDGGGRCIVPGHPKSDIPMDPPPAGTSKTLSFSAERT